MSSRIAIAAGAVGGLLMITGCATVPVDPARRDTQRLLQPALANESAASEQELQSLLAKPLDAGTAVRIALLRNPSVHTEYAQLGIAAAEVFAASRLANPRLGLSVLWPRLSGDDRKVDGELAFGFTDLLLFGASRRAGKASFEAAKLRAAAAVYNLALDVQSAWLDAIGAEQRRTARANIAASAQLSAELATQYHAAGNIDALSLALHSAAGSEAAIEASRAAGDASRARARLRQALGLRASDGAIVLPVSLPPPDVGVVDRAALQTSARAQRLDLAAANEQIRASETRLNSARRFGWLGDSEVGAVAERDGNSDTRRGASLGLPLPVFHQGQGGVARANAELEMARAGRGQLETGLDAELDTQLEQLAESRRQYSLYREQLVPQREAAVARLTEQANFMLASPFELLVARQQEYSAYEGAIEALHDYWQHRIELTRTVGAPLPTLNTESQP
jgi:cobalt-zinc-cadmium efflux system outer membrane protein